MTATPERDVDAQRRLARDFEAAEREVQANLRSIQQSEPPAWIFGRRLLRSEDQRRSR